MHDSPPLSPALKAYLHAFDEYLLAQTAGEQRRARARMLLTLERAGIEPRESRGNYFYRSQQDRIAALN